MPSALSKLENSCWTISWPVGLPGWHSLLGCNLSLFTCLFTNNQTWDYNLELVGVFSPHKLMIGALWGWPSPLTDPLLVEGVEGVSSLGRGGFPPPIAEPGLDVAVLIPHGLHLGSWGFPAITEPELVVASTFSIAISEMISEKLMRCQAPIQVHFYF